MTTATFIISRVTLLRKIKRGKIMPLWIRIMSNRAPGNPVFYVQWILLILTFLGAWIVLLNISNLGSTIQKAVFPRFLASENDAMLQSEASQNIGTVKVTPASAKLVSKVQASIVAQLRRDLDREFEGQNFLDEGVTLDNLILERGGQPIRSLILTAWESDVDFVGGLLQAAHGMFYYRQPFSYLEWKQVRGESLAHTHLPVLEDLLYCNYSGLASQYINFENSDFMLGQNLRVAQYCKAASRNQHRICKDATFLSRTCELFPFQAMHVTRMRLKLIKPLLDDPKMNLRVIYLVRDPRGTIQFRLQVLGCKDPQCVSPSLLCSDLEDDYTTAERFRKEYPDKFMAVRLEDIALDTASAVKRMFRFLHLHFKPQNANSTVLVKRLDSGGVTARGDTQSILAHMSFSWIKMLTKEQMTDTQKYCRNAMTQWGYALRKPCECKCKGRHFNPLTSPPWKWT